MFVIYFRTVLVSWKIYGPGKVFFSVLLGEPLLRCFHAATLWLDRIFFPGYLRMEVKRPVFIIGHPRSGTTFLHHLLTKCDQAAAFPCWHILFPALTGRVLVGPLIRRLINSGKAEVMPEWTGHAMALDKVEEEEMLFLHNFDTQFVTAGLLGFDEREYPELHFHDLQPQQRRFRSMRFLNGLFQRQIHSTGKSQIIAQTHFSTHRLKTMLEFYPDAKFIYIIRNPHHVVPSFLSLLHNSIEFRWGLSKIPKTMLDRYNQRRYQAIIDLYTYFHDLQTQGEIPADRVMVLPYELLRNDLETAFNRIIDFTGIRANDSLREFVTKRASTQQQYQRKHKVKDLKEFGLSHAQINKDFAFVFTAYDFPEDS
ncbi:MAG: sulfotransferase [Proteobacteria bacterium]|nr:sulfotransferase [Desulfobulbaceae bacterium]MBU4152858.1 sulfotransferase [Pseudomonadota bacterium]